MKKIFCALAALSLLGVSCSREDSVSSRVEDMNSQYETEMDTEYGTGVSDEGQFDSGVGSERGTMDSEMDSSEIERSDMEMQREEEEVIMPDDQVRRGTGTGAGSNDAAGMGMDE